MTFQYTALPGGQSPPQRNPSNRRASVRYKCGLATPGKVHIDGQQWQRAWVLDLSLHGVGLLLNLSLKAGLPVVIHLKSNVQKKALEVPARVCHATKQADGDWMVGMEFDNALTEDQLDALLQ